MIFSSDLLTYVESIDAQHKELFNRINAVVALGAKSISKEETEKTLILLDSYIHEHFRDEELLQIQFGYPKFEWHRSLHLYYISECNKLQKVYENTGPSAQFTLLLNKSIIDWIVKHIKNVDVELGRFINGLDTLSMP